MENTRKKIKPDLARNIISRRNLRDWSAEELSKRCDVPYPTLRDIEAGISGGSTKTLSKVASALECSIEELTGGFSPPKAPPTVDAMATLVNENARLRAENANLHEKISDLDEGIAKTIAELEHLERIERRYQAILNKLGSEDALDEWLKSTSEKKQPNSA